MTFSEEYLKDYENKIRKLPVEELHEILDMIRDDPFKADNSPERIQIIEKRILELTGDKDCILPREEYNKKIEQEYFEKTNPLVVGLEVFGALLILIGGIAPRNPHLAEASSNPLSLLICGLGFLIIGLCVLIDGKIKIYLIGWASIWTKKENPKVFWPIVGFLCVFGISLLVYSIPYL
jgi:hypothetical protein